MTNRHLLRSAIQTQRRQLSAEYKQQASIEVCHYIASTAWFRRSQKIGFYVAANGELDPFPLLQYACALGKTCYLPILHPFYHNALWFIAYAPGDPLAVNKYGILEPVKSRHNRCKPAMLDTVFTPLVAFDGEGNRLGSGKGYYDRTFSFLRHSVYWRKPKLVGLAYGFQQVTKLHAQPWDVPLERIVAFHEIELKK